MPLMLSIPERHARRTAARALAVELMACHGLHDWHFAFNRRKRAMGLCRYAVRTIELSIYLVDGNGADEIRDTILHEIAHALVGQEHGHDAAWKRKCLEIGAKPERCGRAEMPLGRWRAHCGGCGQVFSRHRRPSRMRGWFCRACGPQRGQLAWRADGRIGG
jgi:predicted SprT family Zn-dependent metalloprotease